MTGYCDKLHEILENTQNIDWLFGANGLNTLKDAVGNYFSVNEYGGQKQSFVNRVVTQLVQKTDPLLGYFNQYLIKHLEHDFANCPTFNSSTAIEMYGVPDAVDSVVAFFKNRVLTALVLGGYTNDGAEDNSRYPGIDSYIYQNQIRLRKSDVQLIMSTVNTRNQIISAVNSTPFFSDYKTYDSLKQAVSDLETVCPADPNALLFNMKLNPDFAGLSNFVQ